MSGIRLGMRLGTVPSLASPRRGNARRARRRELRWRCDTRFAEVASRRRKRWHRSMCDGAASSRSARDGRRRKGRASCLRQMHRKAPPPHGARDRCTCAAHDEGGSINMPPRFPAHCHGYARWIDSECPRKRTERSSGQVRRAAGTNDLIGQLRMRKHLTAQMPLLCNLVLRVSVIVVHEQVSRIYASRVIATVTHAIQWDASVMKHVRHARCEHRGSGFGICAESRTPTLVQIRQPDPAIIVAGSFGDVSPVAGNVTSGHRKNCQGRLWHVHVRALPLSRLV